MFSQKGWNIVNIHDLDKHVTAEPVLIETVAKHPPNGIRKWPKLTEKDRPNGIRKWQNLTDKVTFAGKFQSKDRNNNTTFVDKRKQDSNPKWQHMTNKLSLIRRILDSNGTRTGRSRPKSVQFR